MPLVNSAQIERKNVKKWTVIFLIIGVYMFSIGAFMEWGLTWTVKTIVKSQLYISKGFSPVRYGIEWSGGRIPEFVGVYIKFYIFTIDNPRQFSQGAKPKLRELGPIRTEVKIDDWGPNEETVIFAAKTQYNYEPDRSIGSLSDNITIINLPIAGAVVKNYLDRFPMSTLSVPVAVGALNLITLTHGEGLMKNITVGQVFTGYPFSVLETLDIFVKPLRWFGFELPEIYEKLDNKIGLFHMINNTWLRPLEVETGQHGTLIGMPSIKSWRHQYAFIEMAWQVGIRFIKYFMHPDCKILSAIPVIRDTSYTIDDFGNGHSFGPGATKSDKIFIFDGNVCSIRYAKYQSWALSWMTPMWRFVPHPQLMSAPKAGKRNDHCLCMTSDNTRLCNGLVSLSACTFSPIAITQPHFLNADPIIQQSVRGLTPVYDKHRTYLDIHPTIGMPVDARVRLQVNLLVEPLSQLIDKVFPFANKKTGYYMRNAIGGVGRQWSPPPAYSPDDHYYVKRSHFGTQTSPLVNSRPSSTSSTTNPKRFDPKPPGSLE
ncbi:scavenger receptor class B member 1-like [Oppia nitens]|uniref:scavenger receptor class B member 1-like n=1 Tax=Oppia nitens TaxID=1686743 RepID=UPI0023DB51EE|nr:scavenger receptor class B member 1-like [Oppia nitens]